MSDPRLREMGLVSELPVWGDTRLGGGRFSENSGIAHVPVDSPTSPNDDVRDGVRGERGYACEGDCGTGGDIGAMIPSALRDDDRRRPGIKPDNNRGSKERVRCIVGGKDDAAMEGEFMESRGPNCVSIRTHRGRNYCDNSPAVGRVLSLALRLRKRNSGVSQTQIPKKVAMSPKDGAFTTDPPPRYALRAI